MIARGLRALLLLILSGSAGASLTTPSSRSEATASPRYAQHHADREAPSRRHDAAARPRVRASADAHLGFSRCSDLTTPARADASDWRIGEKPASGVECASAIGVHRYLYAYGNPGLFVDPDGRVGYLSDWVGNFDETDHTLRESAKDAPWYVGIGVGALRFANAVGSLPARALNTGSNAVAQALPGDDFAAVREQGSIEFGEVVDSTANAIRHPIDTAVAVHGAAVSTTVGIAERDAQAISDGMLAVFSAASGRVVPQLGNLPNPSINLPAWFSKLPENSASTAAESPSGGVPAAVPTNVPNSKVQAELADLKQLASPVSSAVSARRAELDAKFGRSGNLSSDIADRGVDASIRRNAQEAVRLTRADATSGAITPGPQAFGTRAHRYFERMNKALRTQVAGTYNVVAEQFRDSVGNILPRRANGTIGADVLVGPWTTPAFTKNFDLKTYGQDQVPISTARQLEFQSRFGVTAEEIYEQR